VPQANNITLRYFMQLAFTSVNSPYPHIQAVILLIVKVRYMLQPAFNHCFPNTHHSSSQLSMWSTPYNRSSVRLGDATYFTQHAYGDPLHSLCSAAKPYTVWSSCNSNGVTAEVTQSKQQVNTAPSAAMQLQPASQQLLPLHLQVVQPSVPSMPSSIHRLLVGLSTLC
jgi:hypothetical protein